MDWISIIEMVLSFALGGGIASVFMIGVNKSKGKAETKDIAIGSLENTINELSEQLSAAAEREARKDELIERQMTDIADKRCECTTKGYYMCVHQGCRLRCPSLGRGKEYFKSHQSEEDFGADFMTVEELIAKYDKDNANK